jgi:chloramphenicol-sensitive protein RarD
VAGPSPPYALVIGSGLVTALPLLLFAAAAKRIRYADLGLLQYIAPTLQLLLAVFLFDEHLSHAQLLGFVTIWIALAIYATGATLRSRRESVAVPD